MAVFHMKRIPGKKADSKNTGKLASQQPPAQSPRCPECASQRVWKDGIRQTKSGDVQRWLCRSCWHRFSDLKIKVNVVKQSLVFPESVQDFGDFSGVDFGSREVGFEDSTFSIGEDVASHGFSMVGKAINTFLPNSRERQCMRHLDEGAKNMAKVETRLDKAAGATKLSEEDTKGKIIEYTWFMKQEGYKRACIDSYTHLLKNLIRKGANLMDPQQVKRTIGSVETWDDGSKGIIANVYDVFVRMAGLQWNKPRYKYVKKLPFVPTTEEIDILIGGCGFKVRVYLQGLKETGADPSEMFFIEWKDIDFKRKKLAINHPVKYHNPRILEVSDKWLRMVSRMPRASERVWTARYGTHYENFRQRRLRLAYQYDNPRLKRISFRSFRHWKGTMEYHLTKDPFHVRDLLGHKSIKSTEIYIHLEEQLFKQLNSEYEVRRATSIKGMLALAAVGFEKFDHVGNVHLYRKPKSVIDQ